MSITHKDDLKTTQKRVNYLMQEDKEIRTHVPNDAYRDGWDRIFGKKEKQNDDST